MRHGSTGKLPSVRRSEICRRVRESGQIRVGDLADALAVSTMTIQRDLAYLEREGALIRTRGGAISGETANDVRATDTCSVCRRPAGNRYALHLHTPAGSSTVTCCPHCGLTVLSEIARDPGWYAVTPDTLTGRMVNIREGAFVMGSSIAPCCSPSALCFMNTDHATRFAGAFGGTVGTFEDAVVWVHQEMLGHQGLEGKPEGKPVGRPLHGSGHGIPR